MDVLSLALDQRRTLLDEIEALDWFIQTGTELLARHAPAPDETATQIGPIVRMDKAAVQRLIIEEYHRKRPAAAAI